MFYNQSIPHQFHGHHSAGDIVEFLQVIECTENNNLHHFALRIKIVAIFIIKESVWRTQERSCYPSEEIETEKF